VLLSGLRDRVEDGLTAVVTVTDNGGASGRLPQELGIAPPGDVRNCLVALAGRRQLAQVFDYRLQTGAKLRDHTAGNIVIAALADLPGGFCEGVAQAARLLRIRGVVLPAASESLTLVVSYADGSVTRGESTVRDAGKQVARIAAEPRAAAAPPGVSAAIERGDIIVLSPGSLYTSPIPALLGGGIPEALSAFRQPVVYAANLMTQPRGDAGVHGRRSPARHRRARRAGRHRRARQLGDAARAGDRPLSEDGAAPVELDGGECERRESACTRRRCCPTPSAGRSGTSRPPAEAICAIARAATDSG
jgi:uncharacterized cofD-like protein